MRVGISTVFSRNRLPFLHPKSGIQSLDSKHIQTEFFQLDTAFFQAVSFYIVCGLNFGQPVGNSEELKAFSDALLANYPVDTIHWIVINRKKTMNKK